MKTDARVRYTKMRIREAFLQCLRKKPVNKVTVKELCQLAEINRCAAEMADAAVELVYSIPIALKGDIPCLSSAHC